MADNKENAVALRYDQNRDHAPVVVAKGSGCLAERIEQVARESGVPVKEDKTLLECLMAMDLNQEIPPELYQVVAEVLAFVYRMDHNHG